MVAKNLRELDLKALSRGAYTPSPPAWEDQVLYFLMLDRFSDGREQDFRDNDGRTVSGGATPRFQPGDAGNAIQTEADAARWREAGGRLDRRHPEGPGEQDRLPAAPGRDRPLDQPGLQAGALPGYLSRLRHPELPGCRPALRHARRPARTWCALPTATASTSSWISSSTIRECLQLCPRPLLDPGPGQRAGVPRPALGWASLSGGRLPRRQRQSKPALRAG